MIIVVIGAGYVGIYSILNFSKLGHEVVGYDINEEKIALYKSGIDVTKEVGNEAIVSSTAKFTSNVENLFQNIIVVKYMQ